MADKDAQRASRELQETGFVVVPAFVPLESLAKLNGAARQQLSARQPPFEMEADLKYPGAPPSRTAQGGQTLRRLLNAYGRDALFADWAVHPSIHRWMHGYFTEPVLLSRAHHNCLMTKHPHYGSLTGWHRDIRYWSFMREDLVSVWIALGAETEKNGGLWFIPGSHRMLFGAEVFDTAKFFRDDLDSNRALLRSAISPRLNPGDAVFFHCNTLHSAGQNETDAVKLSLVFTYHGASNAPLPHTRSSAQPEVLI